MIYELKSSSMKDLVNIIDLVMKIDLETEEMTVTIREVTEAMIETMIAVRDPNTGMMIGDPVITEMIDNVVIVTTVGTLARERTEEKRVQLNLSPI